MSVEPTCDFCGYSDKLRCRTREQAEGCDQYQKDKMIRDVDPHRKLPRAQQQALPRMTLDQHITAGKVSVSTHHSGVAERLSVRIEKEGRGDIDFFLDPRDADLLIELLQRAQTYSRRGTLK